MTKKYNAQIDFINSLVVAKIITKNHALLTLSSFPLLLIPSNQWKKSFNIAASKKYRLIGIWAQDLSQQFQVTAGIERNGGYLFLRTLIDAQNPEIFSITSHFLSANRLERHMRDMFGIKFIDHPDKRRWTKHQAWQEHQFPLRKNFPKGDDSISSLTPPDTNYPFDKATGSGIYEIPVGPIHAGIIEPGHFRFQVAGEDIINLEERLGYTHKGIEKIAEGRNIESLIKLAGRISGDSTVAYAWATCMACEKAYSITVPERASYLRAIMAERERIANHLGDFAAIGNDVGFSFAYYQFMRLKELWLRMNKQSFGHRLLMDQIKVGGVAIDLSETNRLTMQQQIIKLKKELDTLYPMIEDNSSLHDRLKATGILSTTLMHQLGCLGYVGRSSGGKLDLRYNTPYAPYDKLSIKIPTYSTGDVLARTRIRAQEILVSLELLNELLYQLPAGNITTKWQQLQQSVEGIGLIEGWRGEVLVYVHFDDHGKVERYFPRDPSWFSWPALEQLIHGNIVPDFPVCNKSVNGSYSGVDL
jgi:Ni,Fe-hydrogenase III large subunit/Ni,Fe-hydrogenase III component G